MMPHVLRPKVSKNICELCALTAAMNGLRIEHVMTQLRSETEHCPQCSKQYPKHELACSFVDFKVVDILAEVAINLDPTPDDFMTNVRKFIDERNTRTDFLDAAVHVFTNDAIYPALGITESDLESITGSRGSTYRAIIDTFRLLSALDFFHATDESNVARGGRIISTLQLVYDIKSNYSSSTVSRKQQIVLWYMTWYIRSWVSKAS